MQLTLKTCSSAPRYPTTMYIELTAVVRYWEDAEVNGAADVDGSLIPGRKGDSWTAIIRLRDGYVLDWPSGCVADIFYKVCDAGTYWLLDADKNRVAHWASFYVPDEFLCPDACGHGDYIILNIDANGFIQKWRMPSIDWVEDCADAPQRGWLLPPKVRLDCMACVA